MVREISGFHIEMQASEPDRPDIPDRDFEPLPVQQSDLVDAFCRFAAARSGKFERLLGIWISQRIGAGLPINFEEPESSNLSFSLKNALRAGFERERLRKK